MSKVAVKYWLFSLWKSPPWLCSPVSCLKATEGVHRSHPPTIWVKLFLRLPLEWASPSSPGGGRREGRQALFSGLQLWQPVQYPPHARWIKLRARSGLWARGSPPWFIVWTEMWVFREYILMMIKRERESKREKTPFLKNVLRKGGLGLSARLEWRDCEQQQLVRRRPHGRVVCDRQCP